MEDLERFDGALAVSLAAVTNVRFKDNKQYTLTRSNYLIAAEREESSRSLVLVVGRDEGFSRGKKGLGYCRSTLPGCCTQREAPFLCLHTLLTSTLGTLLDPG